LSRRSGRSDRRFGPPRPRPGDAQDERLAIHRDADEQAGSERAARRLDQLRRLIGPVESEIDWQAGLRMLAGHLEAMGFRIDRGGGHDAWRIYDGDVEITREMLT
jgi:hypothetical protein